MLRKRKQTELVQTRISSISMSNMKKENITKAFNAMKALGIDRDSVRPVLKQLLKVFEQNWEFIEAENYRVLVEAIFENKEEKEAAVKRKKMMEPDECERPSKKVHMDPEEEEDEASSIDLRLNSMSGGRLEPCRTNLGIKRAEPGSCSAMDKEKGKLPCAMISTSEKPGSERASSSSCFKLPLDESGFVSVDGDEVPANHHGRNPSRLNVEQCDTSLIPLTKSTSRIRSGIPDQVEGSSSGNRVGKSSQCVYVENTRECGSGCNFRRSDCKFEIASSPSGDVKLCCVSTVRQTISHVPNVDAVLNSVEEKFLRFHKIVGPPFSLKKLLKELCKGFFTMTTDSTGRLLVRNPSSEVTSSESLCCRKKPLC